MCGTGVLCESTGAVSGMKSAVRATELATERCCRRRVEARRRFSASWKRCACCLVAGERKFSPCCETICAVDGCFETPLMMKGTGRDPRRLVATDVTDKLHAMSPPRRDGDKVTKKRSMTVTDDGKLLRFTNELEAIGGEVYANVLERPCLAHSDGKVTGGESVGFEANESEQRSRGRAEWHRVR